MLGEITAQSRADASTPDDWLAAICDVLMAEYGLSLHEAVWRFPLEAAAALAPSRVRRHGGKWAAPDASDRAVAAARARAKDWLKAHFTILPPGESGPPDALGEWMRGRPPRSHQLRDQGGAGEG